MPDRAPRTTVVDAEVQPVATAGNDLTTILGRCPEDGTVSAVTYIPLSTVTGAATNNRTYAVVNKGQDGLGSTTVASLNMANGTNAAGADEKAITLSGTPANLVVVAGDVLAFTSTHIGTGITDPGGYVRVEVSRST